MPFNTRRILLTGFEPFLTHKTNPSEQLVRDLSSNNDGETEIQGHVLPVDAVEVKEKIISLIKKENWDLIILCGLAANRDYVSFEQIAINYLHFQNEPDNHGRVFQNQKICEQSPLALETDLKLVDSLEKWNKEVKSKSLIAKLSHHAGTYLCNQTYFLVLDSLRQEQKSRNAFFLHIPALKTECEYSELKTLIQKTFF